MNRSKWEILKNCSIDKNFYLKDISPRVDTFLIEKNIEKDLGINNMDFEVFYTKEYGFKFTFYESKLNIKDIKKYIEEYIDILKRKIEDINSLYEINLNFKGNV